MLSSSASLRQKTHVPKPQNTGNNRCFLEKPVSCEKTYRKSNSIATCENGLRERTRAAVATKNGEARRRFRLVCGSVCLVAVLGFHHHRQDAPELQDAEEAVAAGIAAVGGKSQPALQEDEGSGFHAFTGNMLEVEIPAAGTVRVAFQTGGHPPGVKAPVTAVTSPGPQTRQTG
jgi:hypothetical protein